MFLPNDWFGNRVLLRKGPVFDPGSGGRLSAERAQPVPRDRGKHRSAGCRTGSGTLISGNRPINQRGMIAPSSIAGGSGCKWRTTLVVSHLHSVLDNDLEPIPLRGHERKSVAVQRCSPALLARHANWATPWVTRHYSQACWGGEMTVQFCDSRAFVERYPRQKSGLAARRRNAPNS